MPLEDISEKDGSLMVPIKWSSPDADKLSNAKGDPCDVYGHILLTKDNPISSIFEEMSAG